MDKVLARYDAAAIRRLFEETGLLRAVERKGFTRFDIVVESAGRALPHALLFGHKGNRRLLLLDACLGEASVRPDFFRRRGYELERPVEFAVVHWIREEDPSAAFTANRPPLPLQEHPGLGVLRQAFRTAVRMATELHKDGVVSVPKFFHDAVIFYRSRLFLFLDAEEQGRFEALLRDLRFLSLRDASLAMATGRVRDQLGHIASWTPSYQVFPLSAPLTAYFHSNTYATQVSAGQDRHHFVIVPAVPEGSSREHSHRPSG